ncbi:MAG: hypothetical protein AAFO91_03780 [Bacteroidota bacterium]
MLFDEPARAVVWEAPEHSHQERSNDWFWALGIIALGGAAAAIFLGNFLLTLLIIIGAAVIALIASREPAIIEYAVTVRGVKIGNTIYPYTTLESYAIDDLNEERMQLLVKSQKMFLPLLVIPIPAEFIDDIEDLLSARLEEEDLEEPLSHKLMEQLGF